MNLLLYYKLFKAFSKNICWLTAICITTYVCNSIMNLSSWVSLMNIENLFERILYKILVNAPIWWIISASSVTNHPALRAEAPGSRSALPWIWLKFEWKRKNFSWNYFCWIKSVHLNMASLNSIIFHPDAFKRSVMWFLYIIFRIDCQWME